VERWGLHRADLRLLAGVGALAFVARLLFALAVQRDLSVFNDELFYHHAAETLSDGQGLRATAGGPTAQWPPAYPFALSLVYRITGPEPLAGQALNALIGAFTVVGLFLLARRLFGRREAVVAALLLAVLPGQVLWSDVLLAETPYALVLVAFFLALAALPPRPLVALGVGALIGLAALVRGEGLLLFPAALTAWWPVLSRRAFAVRAATAGVAALVVIAPWTLRNAVVMDAFIPLSSNASITLYSGHNPRADGAQNYAPASVGAGLPAFGPEREVAESKRLRREALDYMVTHPLREAELVPLKLLNLARGDSHAMEWVNTARPGEPRPIRGRYVTPIRVAADSTWFALLAGTLASTVVFGRAFWRDPVLRGVLVLFAVALVAYGFVYYGNFRYRAPLEPLMLLVSAPLLVRLWELRETS
jgi:4-amino-4-deoxy-L-arabinose transferase-like glycosyltransferase